MLGSWLSKKAEKNQSFADNNVMKMFHDALKSSGTTLMTDKDVVLNRRAKLINDNTTNILPQGECNVLLDESQTVTETTNTIQLCHRTRFLFQT